LEQRYSNRTRDVPRHPVDRTWISTIFATKPVVRRVQGRRPMSPRHSRLPAWICIFALCGCVATITEEEVGDSTGTRSGRGSETPLDAGSGDEPTIALFDDADTPADSNVPEPECTPRCAGLECGDDGCGGTCGTCASGSTCKAGVCESTAPPAGSCPPTGTTGNWVGAIAPQITLYECDGTPVRTHAACGSPVYVYSHSESCGSCIYWAQTGANDFDAQLRAAGAEFYFVITVGRGGGTPDGSLCERVRSEYGLGMPVLYLPDMWDFAEAYGSTGAGPGALLDPDHRIATTGSAKSSYDRPRILDVAASF
jgi:hypothetical protein